MSQFDRYFQPLPKDKLTLKLMDLQYEITNATMHLDDAVKFGDEEEEEYQRARLKKAMKELNRIQN